MPCLKNIFEHVLREWERICVKSCAPPNFQIPKALPIMMAAKKSPAHNVGSKAMHKSPEQIIERDTRIFLQKCTKRVISPSKRVLDSSHFIGICASKFRSVKTSKAYKHASIERMVTKKLFLFLCTLPESNTRP